MTAGARVVLLGKPDCHLCHEMHAVVVRVLGDAEAVAEKDVREDPELKRLYAFQIPVLLVDGREVARHRIDEEDLRERLRPFGLP